MLYEKFKELGEHAASGAFEEPERSLFYRKALGIRRYYENCELYRYEGKPLYPSGTRQESMAIYPVYLNGLQLDENRAERLGSTLVEAYKADFCRYASKLPAEHTVAGDMYCHSVPNYGRIIREGLDSYIERIRLMEDRDMSEGLLHVCEGIRCYVNRCADYLKSENADEKLIRALEKVPFQKADTIYEAIVAWNFILYLDNCDNLGCLAKELYPFYHGEDVTPLLENLFDNLDANGGYSTALHTDYNELTLQCLKAAKGKRRPMIELFVDENTPREIWDAAFELMRTHGGQPAFYNPRVFLTSLQKRLAIRDADITGFCGVGCAESSIAGYSCIGSLDAGINLLLILEQVANEHLTESRSFEEFYARYIRAVKAVAENVMDKISLSQEERAALNPVPMRTLLVDDCIDNGRDFYNGGARYNWSIINFAGTINVIDSLLVLRDTVFAGKITAETLLEKLKNNDEAFLSECRKHGEAFGRDQESVNALARRLSSDVFSMLDDKKPHIGTAFVPASIQFMSQVYAGERIGATPDGRKAGAPLCDSLGAIFGKDTDGPTALLKSVTALDLAKAVGTPILNFNIDESWSDDVLKSLILSYMKMGGAQMQITCVSEEELRDAYAHPDLHRNLVVRVGGYSEYFCRLSDELKRMILDRTIQKSHS